MKNLKLTFAFLIASVLIANSSSAQTQNNNEAFVVKYIGDKNDYLVFEVEMYDASAKNKTIRISDLQDGEMYAQYLEGNITKMTYKIEKREGQIITFNLTSNKKEYNKTFSYNVEVVETVSILDGAIAIK